MQNRMNVLWSLAIFVLLGCSRPESKTPEPAPSTEAPTEEGEASANASADERRPPPPDSEPAEPCRGAVLQAHPHYCFPSMAAACDYLKCPDNKCETTYSDPPQVGCAKP